MGTDGSQQTGERVRNPGGVAPSERLKTVYRRAGGDEGKSAAAAPPCTTRNDVGSVDAASGVLSVPDRLTEPIVRDLDRGTMQASSRASQASGGQCD
jgi:hypothetical protein